MIQFIQFTLSVIEFANELQKFFFIGVFDLLLLGSQVVIIPVVCVQKGLVKGTDQSDIGINFHVLVFEFFDDVAREMHSMGIDNFVENSIVKLLISIFSVFSLV